MSSTRTIRRAKAGTTEPAWVKWSLIAVALGFIFLFLVLPLAAVFTEALRKGGEEFLLALKEPDAWSAIRLTLLIAATIFANFVNFTSMPMELKEWITHLGLSPIMIVAAMMMIYILLGTVMEELTMVLLTIPLFFPIVVELGFDPVWFGVLIVMVIQIGLISPPVGMNLFVINTLLPKVGLGNIFRGVWPQVLVLIITLAILLAFPGISLWLPSMMD